MELISRPQISSINVIYPTFTKTKKRANICSSTSPSEILPLEHDYHRLKCLLSDSAADGYDLNLLQVQDLVLRLSKMGTGSWCHPIPAIIGESKV